MTTALIPVGVYGASAAPRNTARHRPLPEHHPLEHTHRGVGVMFCFVCTDRLDTAEAHTYHQDGCPIRDERPCAQPQPCAQLTGCGEDVHDECCPTCTGQAF